MQFSVDVSQRRRTDEVMDDPAIDDERHASALRGLARVNFWSGSARALWSSIAASRLAIRGAPLRILDVASGGGDVPISLWKRARRAGLDVEVVGCDVSPFAVDFARQQAALARADVEFRLCDVLRGDLPVGFDVVTCSLFLHHLDDGDAEAFLRKAAATARRLLLVDDLVRSRGGHLFARIGTHIVSRCDVVHIDGPRSVEGAFTVEEAQTLGNRAGLQSAQVVRRFPWRWLLAWTPP